jgi:hypothetical protein
LTRRGGPNGRTLRRRCEAKLKELVVSSPFDLGQFCEALGRDRGRPIIPVPIALPGRAPCGMWAVTDDADYIFIQKQTSPLHQALIGLHEVSHLLFGHTESDGVNPQTQQLLAPTLDPDTVRYMLRRTHYTAVAEREAEMLASLILNQVGVWASAEPTGPIPPEVLELVNRLETSLANDSTGPHV